MTKYKSVPVENMTIWQLGQAIHEGSEFYDEKGKKIEEKAGFKLETMFFNHESIVKQLGKCQITTREPIAWYEVDGVFDCAKLCHVGGERPIFIFEYDDNRGCLKDGFGSSYSAKDCIPISREEAAEYGVE